jgi:hypothetical protein
VFPPRQRSRDQNVETRYVAVVDTSGIPFLHRVVADDFSFIDSWGEELLYRSLRLSAIMND